MFETVIDKILVTIGGFFNNLLAWLPYQWMNPFVILLFCFVLAKFSIPKDARFMWLKVIFWSFNMYIVFYAMGVK